AAGSTLAAYAIGLLPFVMMRSFTAPFYARGDTLTPVKAALLAAAVNISFKVMLMGPLAQVGLAFATSVGAWINLSLLTFFAKRRGFAVSGAGLRPVIRLFIAGAVLAVALYFGNMVLARAFAGMHYLREETTLAVLLLIGVVVYGAAVLLLLGRGWVDTLFKDVGTAADAPLPKTREQPDPTAASSALPDNPPPPRVEELPMFAKDPRRISRRNRLRSGPAVVHARGPDYLRRRSRYDLRSISSTSAMAMGLPRKIAPTRAKRSGESVAKKRMREALSVSWRMPLAVSASATTAAVVSAEATMLPPSPIACRMASASTGKCVQPSTIVSGAAAPSNIDAR